jgi:hypothetical protein
VPPADHPGVSRPFYLARRDHPRLGAPWPSLLLAASRSEKSEHLIGAV